MKHLLNFIIVFIVLTYNVFGQTKDPILNGKVSFVTSNNIYVKFDNTQNIAIGDSLKLSSTKTSCLVVKSKSSSSVVSQIINDCEIQKGDGVFFVNRPKKEVKIVEPKKEFTPVVLDADELQKEPEYKEKIRGRISASTYSNILSNRDDRHRFMSRLSVDADHIKGSKFSFNTYLNYRYILDQKETSSLQNNSFLRVYNLGARYDATPTLSITLGRNINPKISSIGAIDGLQVEKYFGNNYAGAIVGFRPDIFDYGFNADLLQYGGYVGNIIKTENFYAQTTLGAIEQRGNGDIDRRYTYLQHSSTLFRNLNVFSSMEMDIFSKINNETKNDLRLTNLYVSARYRFSRKLNLMLSYDSRKRIIYYETFQTELERLLDDDIARQGVRARINFRPYKNILAGGSYSKRFQSDRDNKSDNIYGYSTLTKVPKIGGRLSLTYNRNESNYLLSNIGAARYSRSFLKGRLNTDLYYRLVFYDYTSGMDSLEQHYFGTNLSYNINRKLLFSISGELSTFNDENNIRIYSRMIQRF
ncbi:hypothetical protein [Maribacter sp. HTCC2170]|uniref:hypothetical protein n=1 Tax=Maribacter sp. (strain HTCC2170 / KCCM 42371) TaxID=313603 RepID=UPI00006B4758|nr:hypothetical protein [Maribacter sp. HTCC2170]EAR01811.1 hypothetical protein FB2170_14823 [Maribacter sp. HTCC2170]